MTVSSFLLVEKTYLENIDENAACTCTFDRDSAFNKELVRSSIFYSDLSVLIKNSK